MKGAWAASDASAPTCLLGHQRRSGRAPVGRYPDDRDVLVLAGKDAKLTRFSSEELAADPDTLPLWDSKTPFPPYEAMRDLDVVTHVQVERAQRGGYHYLHEPATAWHNGALHAGWANHPLFEANEKDELLRGRRSTDSGLTWGPAATPSWRRTC